MAENTFPDDWREQPCFVVSIPRPLVPYVGGLMRIAEQRGFWSSADDYERGYTAVIEFEGCLMATCLSDLIESNDRIYRMLDTALYGKEYTVVSTDPLVVTPGIPAAHELIFQDGFGLLYQADRITQLVDNSINGTETPLYSYAPSVKALLQSVIDGLGSGDDELATIIARLETLAVLLG